MTKEPFQHMNLCAKDTSEMELHIFSFCMFHIQMLSGIFRFHFHLRNELYNWPGVLLLNPPDSVS